MNRCNNGWCRTTSEFSSKSPWRRSEIIEKAVISGDIYSLKQWRERRGAPHAVFLFINSCPPRVEIRTQSARP